METHGPEQALSEARTLFDGGDERGALTALEKLLATAKKTRDAGLLEEALPVAGELAGRSGAPTAAGYGRLVQSLEANLAFARRAGPKPSRIERRARLRRALVMFGLCIVLPGLALFAVGSSTIAIVWMELGLFGSWLFFVLSDWKLSTLLCLVASLFLMGSGALFLGAAVFAASIDGIIALGLLVALIGGVLGLVGCVTTRDSPRIFVFAESLSALIAAGAVALLASDRDALSHITSGAGTTQSEDDLTPLITLWVAAALVIVSGVVVALTHDRPRP